MPMKMFDLSILYMCRNLKAKFVQNAYNFAGKIMVAVAINSRTVGKSNLQSRTRGGEGQGIARKSKEKRPVFPHLFA